LNKLARTKTQELERLPTLFKQLQTSMTEQTSVFNGWVKHRKQHATTQATLISELSALGHVQIQLVAQLKTYQSTITPPDYLKSDTTQLESDTVKLEDGLSELVNAQIKIEQSQTKITGSQTEIQAELKELNRLLEKLEK
jgi:chromosome segregation ATPase